MAGINPLQSVKISDLTNQTRKSDKKQIKDDFQVKDFGQTIKDFIKAVNTDQVRADKAVSDVVQGHSENLHQAMATMEEARLSFQLMIEIRNKLLESYQRLERMQV